MNLYNTFFNKPKKPNKFLLIFVGIMFVCLKAEAGKKIAVNDVEVSAVLAGENITFTVKNTGIKDILIDDGFCLFDKVKTLIVSEPNFTPRKDYFESAMARSACVACVRCDSNGLWYSCGCYRR